MAFAALRGDIALPVNDVMWLLALVLAVGGGWMDWRTRRLPNWWTVSGLALGIALHAALLGWPGARSALLGAGLGLLVLFPFVWVRAMGGGDWKLMGALGAFLGPEQLLLLLYVSAIAAGVMAVIEIVRRKRVQQTLSNMGRLIVSLVTLGRYGGTRQEVSLDNPRATTVPFGVAVALATVICCGGHWLARK